MSRQGSSNGAPRNGWGVYHWREYGMEALLPDARPGARVLLLGCGDAGERPFLRDRGYEPIGLDIKRASGVDALGDAHRLPFEHGAFDLVLSMQVLEHLHSPWIAVEETARVLRPGGWFLGSVAFMKPYHNSYFHMTHRGVRHLLDAAGLETDHVSGAQSVTYSLYGTLLPIGSPRLRRAVLGAVDRVLRTVRVKAWSWTRREDPDRPIDRFHEGFPISFRRMDELRCAPAVVFRARKREGPGSKAGGAREREGPGSEAGDARESRSAPDR